MRRIAGFAVLTFFLSLFAGSVQSLAATGPARLIKDINIVPANDAGSWADEFAPIGGSFVFWAHTKEHGYEPWRTDGTPEGTVLLKDIAQGAGSYTSGPLPSPRPEFERAGDTLYFNLGELFRTDGTEAGTMLVKDINPGFGAAFTSQSWARAASGSMLFFLANDGAHGVELWRSDGTEAGTILLADIRPGTATPFPFPDSRNLAPYQGGLIFAANDGVHGSELWRSDGTPAGTFMLKDLRPGDSSASPFGFQELDGRLLFRARAGMELWTTDGTAEGTVMLQATGAGCAGFGSVMPRLGPVAFFNCGRNLYKTDGSAAGTTLVKVLPNPNVGFEGVVGDALIFVNDSGDGGEPWRTDGTEAGTHRIMDIRPGLASSSLRDPVVAGGRLYFTADDGVHGRELWSTDGTTAGTFLVKDVRPGTAGSAPGQLVVDGSNLYFGADSGDGVKLWRSDGTEAGTIQVSSLPLYRIGAFQNGAVLFSAAHPSLGNELFSSNGTPAGTSLVKDINPFVHTNGSGLQYFQGVVGAAGGPQRMIVDLNDGVHGRELWATDGTAAGTQLVKDIRPGPGDAVAGFSVVLDGVLYFHADDGVHGAELWRTDGTETGTSLVADINPGPGSSGPRIAVLNGRLYLNANDGVHGRELWQSDGTAAGTSLVADIRQGSSSSLLNFPFSLVAMGGTLYFDADDGVHGREPWRSDGTPEGTSMLKDIVPGRGSSGCCEQMTRFGDKLFFMATTLADGKEPWVSDGTEQGTSLLANLVAGPAGSSVIISIESAGRIYFVKRTEPPPEEDLGEALDEALGDALWVSDGTQAGTFVLKDTVPGFETLTIYLADSDGTLFFAANSPPSPGYQLWKSDGTPGGTVVVKGGFPTHPAMITGVEGGLLLTGIEDAHGAELWRSDGTEEGTVMVQDINPGHPWSGPWLITPMGNRVFFAAEAPVSGMELYTARTAVALHQPRRALWELRDQMVGLGLATGIQMSLRAKLREASDALAAGRTPDAIVALEEFIHLTEVMSPRRIPAAAAADLVEFARDIVSLLNGEFD